MLYNGTPTRVAPILLRGMTHLPRGLFIIPGAACSVACTCHLTMPLFSQARIRDTFSLATCTHATRATPTPLPPHVHGAGVACKPWAGEGVVVPHFGTVLRAMIGVRAAADAVFALDACRTEDAATCHLGTAGRAFLRSSRAVSRCLLHRTATFVRGTGGARVGPSEGRGHFVLRIYLAFRRPTSARFHTGPATAKTNLPLVRAASTGDVHDRSCTHLPCSRHPYRPRRRLAPTAHRAVAARHSLDLSNVARFRTRTALVCGSVALVVCLLYHSCAWLDVFMPTFAGHRTRTSTNASPRRIPATRTRRHATPVLVNHLVRYAVAQASPFALPRGTFLSGALGMAWVLRRIANPPW